MRDSPLASDIDHWLARLPADQRTALEKFRVQIRAAAPSAEEAISYGQPTFKLHGHLVAFGAFKKHLSFFPMSYSIIATFPEAEPFVTSKGTMQFQPDKPIPAALVKKIVKRRIAQNLEVADERAASKKEEGGAKEKEVTRPSNEDGPALHRSAGPSCNSIRR